MSKISRADAIAPFFAMEMLRAANARAATGAETFRLEVGEPAGGAPAAVRAAAAAALESGSLGYTDALGLGELRGAIAAHASKRHGVEVPPERVVVTTGSSAGFILTFLACFEPGARVAIAEPGYPAYRNILAALGLEAVPLPVGAESGYAVEVSHLERAAAEGPLAGALVASPANPTGVVQTPASIAAMTAWCDGNGVRFISDEIYHGLSFGAPCETALASSSRAIVINSFSKYFGMTGWRIGWLIAPDDLIAPIQKLAQNMFISPPTLSQRAAIAAFGAGTLAECDAKVAVYRRNRDAIVAALRGGGIEDMAPADGAFYLYANVSPFTDDSMAFAGRMLDETGVAATPGRDFDRARGDRFMRFSVAGDAAMITAAAARLEPWLAGQRRNA